MSAVAVDAHIGHRTYRRRDGNDKEHTVIWAILIFLGIPLWLIAVALFLLIRTRSKVGKIPGSVPCKVRSTAPIPGVHDDFPRHMSSAHWVHDVLIIHSGTFLIQTLPLGVTAGASEPATAHHRTAKFEEPTSIRVTLDSGAEVELVCAATEADRLLGPFSTR